MDVEIAKYSGCCFGVKRALKMAGEALDKNRKAGKKVYTLGSIIHNPGVVKELSGKGLLTVSGWEEVESGSSFVVRSHGMPPDIIKNLKDRSVDIIDATCPYVKKAQSIARKMADEGFHIIVIGDRDHPEVCGIKEQVEDSRIDVVSSIGDLPSIRERKKMGVVIQTTQTMKKLKEITTGLLDKTKELYLVNTICDTTKNRQDAVRDLSRRVDVMLVVGGKDSANTTHLARISSENNPRTFHIEDSSQLKKDWLKDSDRVGISGGASTPEKDILEIADKIGDMRL